MTAELQKTIFDLLKVLSENVRTQMDVTFKDSPNKPLALHEASGVGKATIQRILAGPHHTDTDPASPRLDTIVRLCWVFDVPLQRLLTPQNKRSRMLQPLDESIDEITSSELKRRRGRKTSD